MDSTDCARARSFPAVSRRRYTDQTIAIAHHVDEAECPYNAVEPSQISPSSIRICHGVRAALKYNGVVYQGFPT